MDNTTLNIAERYKVISVKVHRITKVIYAFCDDPANNSKVGLVSRNKGKTWRVEWVRIKDEEEADLR